MKLQNIENLNLIADLQNDWSLNDTGNTIVLKQYGAKYYQYNSLSELYRHWKDYEPLTLLPKDIREGFKQWAKFNNVDKVTYNNSDSGFSWFSSTHEKVGALTIDFDKPIENLEDGEEYTVKELVGE